LNNNDLKKPQHVKEHIWRQHLAWMDVVGKQAEDNSRHQKKRSKRSNSVVTPNPSTEKE